jgi:UDP:flavonoid glycosyltransferase YjiC (YdhE family)
MSLVLSVTEYGYEEAAKGFSLSYNTTVERAKEIMPKYAHGRVAGENKFLRTMSLWIDCKLPRYMWAEADQYKVGTTTLSESTVHTLKKRPLNVDDFAPGVLPLSIQIINGYIVSYRERRTDLMTLKANLPEGFLQRRVWHMSYANLQNIVAQRSNHPVRLWSQFIDEVCRKIEHLEFVVP